jgi:hypothetical protein
MHFVGAAAVIVYVVPRTFCCASLDRRDLGFWEWSERIWTLIFPIPSPRSFKPLLSLRPQPIRFLGIQKNALSWATSCLCCRFFFVCLCMLFSSLLFCSLPRINQLSCNVNDNLYYTMAAFGLRPSGAEPIFGRWPWAGNLFGWHIRLDTVQTADS